MMARKKKQHVIKKKSYNTLGDLKKEIEDAGVEKVKEFLGFQLTTNARVYSLFDNQLVIKDL